MSKPLGSEIFECDNPVTGTVNRKADYGDFITSFLPWHDRGMGPETKDGETCLYHAGSYYILNGDWMLTYAELAPQGYDACFAFFCRKYPEFGSSWSERPQ